jgi:hypothetical protein
MELHFRLVDQLQVHVSCWSGAEFDFHQVYAGVHVRHGDKASDGHKLQSFEAQIAAIQKSPECKPQQSSPANVNNIVATCHLDTNEVMPLFVASDDALILLSAQSHGYLAFSPGVSQQTSTVGMLSTLVSKHEVAYNATLEIISDIFYLSRCSTLVGICSSQVFSLALILTIL